MSKKYEQLIQSIINEDEARARALFHDIVVEKSRQIYESMMEDEDQVDDLMSDVDSEHTGSEFDDEEFGVEGGSDDFDVESEFDDADDSVDSDDFESLDGDAGETEELEDRVVDLEDQLDELMAEFEQMMASQDSDDEGSDQPAEDDLDLDADAEDEETLAEAIELKKVNVARQADVNTTKSPVAANSGKTGSTAKPVSISGSEEKGRPAPTAKKIEFGQGKAPKPVTTEPSGVNDRSPISESRKVGRTTRQLRK